MTYVKDALNKLYEAERSRLLEQDALGREQGEFAHPVFGEGCMEPKLVLIGEAPGAEETRQGHPFVGKAGRQLDELLLLAKIGRGSIYITNTVKYRPVVRSEKTVRNRTPKKTEIEAGMALLKEELLLLRPCVVATLGNVPLGAVAKIAGEESVTVGAVHGKAMTMRIEDFAFLLYPMYHPASTIYRRDLLPVCEEDAARLGELLGENVTSV